MPKLVLGLIGGIATGKSTAAHFFEDQGIEVIDTDDIARDLVKKNTPALKQIILHFGPSILTETHELDRTKLRKLIFTKPTERLWLENLLHPLIRAKVQQQIMVNTSPYCVVAIPLLKKRSDYPFLQKILFIASPRSQQIERLMMRSLITRPEAEAIIAAQPSQEEFKSIADICIENSDSVASLVQKLHLLHQQFIRDILQQNPPLALNKHANKK